MMNFVLSFVFLVLFFGCSTAPTQKNREPSSQKKTLPGRFYKVDLKIFSNQEYRTTHKQLSDLKLDGFRQMIFGTRSFAQRSARLTALNFCLEKGFDATGAVFRRGEKLTGVHCLKDFKSRKRLLYLSFGAGCEFLNYEKRGCREALRRAQNHRFDEYFDQTKAHAPHQVGSAIK